MEQGSLLQVQKFPHRFLLGVLRLLSAEILHPGERPKFHVFPEEHDPADDAAMSHSDGLSMYFRDSTGIFSGWKKRDIRSSVPVFGCACFSDSSDSSELSRIAFRRTIYYKVRNNVCKLRPELTAWRKLDAVRF